MRIKEEYIINDLSQFSSDLSLEIEIIDRFDVVGEVFYGVCGSEYGDLFVAIYNDCICWLGLIVDNNIDLCIDILTIKYPNALLLMENNRVGFVTVDGLIDSNVKLLLSGTSFQLDVWKSLLMIPNGKVISYKSICQYIGASKAYRAIGTAIGNNPISIIIPCHRVINSDGNVGKYLWGQSKKIEILRLETEDITH